MEDEEILLAYIRGMLFVEKVGIIGGMEEISEAVQEFTQEASEMLEDKDTENMDINSELIDELHEKVENIT